METLLTKAEKQRIAKSCRENPYKMFNILESICKELQLMDISTFSEKSIKSKRTIYNMVSDPEFADMEFLQICDQKFIPAVLNKDILI
jgi:hypothetical protein